MSCNPVVRAARNSVVRAARNSVVRAARNSVVRAARNPVVRFATAAIVASLSLPSAVRADEGRVHVTVVAVKATPAGDGVTPGVGAGLERVAAKLQRLPFARFESESTSEHDVAPGQRVTIPFASSGRLVLAAKAVDGRVELELQEFAPAADKPCLEHRAQVEPGRTHVTFCDGVPSKSSTLVFLSTVRP